MITKTYGIDFGEIGLACTLDKSEVTCKKVTSGIYTREHPDGWIITGEVHEDYYVWVEDFTAIHPEFGEVSGSFDGEIRATSEEAFTHFYYRHKPDIWDKDNI